MSVRAHEPQASWFFTLVTAPRFTQSTLLGTEVSAYRKLGLPNLQRRLTPTAFTSVFQNGLQNI